MTLLRSLITSLMILAISAGSLSAGEITDLLPETKRQRQTERTFIFSRTQLKYGLNRDNYLGRWIDRPLLVDPDLGTDEGDEGPLSYAAYVRMQQVSQEYGLDGLAFFPGGFRSITYRYTSKSKVDGFRLLTELSPPRPGDLKKGFDSKASSLQAISDALLCPESFRIGDKLVITSYTADKASPDYWRELLAEARRRHGDRILFLPSIVRFGGESLSYWISKFNDDSITADDIARIKEPLRQWLRATDGLHFASPGSIRTTDRRFHERFYRDFVIAVMKSVLAEPEFKGKLLSLCANVGHENTTRFGYTQSSDGTKTLRRSMEAALDAEPEIINIPEWDEQNENTSLRPTIYNSRSSLRIMRYYTAKARGELPAPFPGDDTTLPDLIISYRKLLTLGEKLEVELLHVPDSGNLSQENGTPTYQVRLKLENLKGKIVYSSPPFEFKKNELRDHTLTIPSETLTADEILLPRLEIDSDGKTRSFGEGLHYIALRPTWNWDYKWVKQPLRDLLTPGEAAFKVGAAEQDGRRTVGVKFDAGEPLAYLEVLDNDDVVYSHSSPLPEWRENADQVIVSLKWQALPARTDAVTLNGEIALEKTTARWNLPPANHHLLQGQRLVFENEGAHRWAREVLIAIPRHEVAQAVLKINLNGLEKIDLPVQQILRDGVYGLPGPRGFNLVVSRYLRAYKMPSHLNTTGAEFSIPVLPDLPGSILHLQAVGKSGRLYRSRPVATLSEGQPPAQRTKATVYSATRHHPVEVEVGADRIPDLQYQFDPRHGSALVTAAGRPFYGILGGFVTQVTQRGGGESGDGTPFIRPEDRPGNATASAPAWVLTEEGAPSLKFDGKGTFIALPQGVIPRRSGFTITMDIKPETSAGKQVLVANRSYYPGTLTVYTEEGVLKFDFAREDVEGVRGIDSGLSLPPGKWSHLVIRYDQKMMIIEVDGEASRPVEVGGPGLYDTVSVVGGFGPSWFEGEIKSLRIVHQP